MRRVRLWFALTLLALSRRFQKWANWGHRMVSHLYGVEDVAQEDGLPPDDQVFFLLKRSDGMYNFHGLVAMNKADARQQAWKIPGSLLVLDSLDEFRIKLLAEADRRRHG